MSAPPPKDESSSEDESSEDEKPAAPAKPAPKGANFIEDCSYSATRQFSIQELWKQAHDNNWLQIAIIGLAD